ncbi:hypothetical protein FDECE_2479 [Fusarium decemcellulare]|nr:hypothetical protein FDECE_2479 [Fusarium decemcellulare]
MADTASGEGHRSRPQRRFCQRAGLSSIRASFRRLRFCGAIVDGQSICQAALCPLLAWGKLIEPPCGLSCPEAQATPWLVMGVQARDIISRKLGRTRGLMSPAECWEKPCTISITTTTTITITSTARAWAA